MPDIPNRLHGNAAKADPHKHLESLFQTNPITALNRAKAEPLVTSAEDNAEYARRLSEDIEL